MPLVATDPQFQNLTRQASKLMEQMQKGYFNFCPSDTWTPAANLYETDEAYIVCVDLAGVDKEKIDVEVVEHRLKIRGARSVPADSEALGGDLQSRRVRVHLMEIDHGSFCREVELPEDVVHEKITANHRNGLLWIELPKK